MKAARNPPGSRARLALPAFLVLCALPAVAQDNAVVDSVSAVFRNDSVAVENIREVEAGGKPKDTTQSLARNDSLTTKLKRRGPYVGLSLGVSFTKHSEGGLNGRFSKEMHTQAAADSQNVLQEQDPVHVFFPAGLVLGIPVARHFDVLLRTEHFYYKVTGLAQDPGEAAKEYWYSNQGHLAGAGVRWMVPVSLLTVNGEPGLFVSYTHFWNFGPTGIRTPDGSLRALTDPAGAGYEIQAGFQQDFDKRWALTGGLSYAQFHFRSNADWSNVTPSQSGQAEWDLTSMRFALQGLYQFGRGTK